MYLEGGDAGVVVATYRGFTLFHSRRTGLLHVQVTSPDVLSIEQVMTYVGAGDAKRPEELHVLVRWKNGTKETCPVRVAGLSLTGPYFDGKCMCGNEPGIVCIKDIWLGEKCLYREFVPTTKDEVLE